MHCELPYLCCSLCIYIKFVVTILCNLHALTVACVLCCTLPSNFSTSARAKIKHGDELAQLGMSLNQAGDGLPQAGAGRHDQ